MKKNLASIADLAKLAGVSKSTVSRALAGSPLVNSATRERIEALAREHNFRPNLPARYLSLGASRTIGFVTHACAESDGAPGQFSLEIQSGVAAGLKARSFDLLALYIDPLDESWAADYLDSGLVAGFILMTSEHKRRHLDLLLELEAPFVAWGNGKGRFCSVVGDNVQGGRLAAERLLALGRRRIAMIGGPKGEAEADDRLRGFSAVLAAAGQPLDPRRLVHGDYGEGSGLAAAEALLAADPELDAIFAASDLMAIAALRRLAAHGRRVPEDVAVIGYDDIRLAAYVSPALTTVSQHIQEAGRYLAEDLIARIDGGPISTRVLPVELVIRNSA